jgi:hypothetical protein
VPWEPETKADYSLTPPTKWNRGVTNTPGTIQKGNIAMSNIIAVPLNKLTRSARNVRKSAGEGQALRLFQSRGLTYNFFTN